MAYVSKGEIEIKVRTDAFRYHNWEDWNPQVTVAMPSMWWDSPDLFMDSLAFGLFALYGGTELRWNFKGASQGHYIRPTGAALDTFDMFRKGHHNV